MTRGPRSRPSPAQHITPNKSINEENFQDNDDFFSRLTQEIPEIPNGPLGPIKIWNQILELIEGLVDESRNFANQHMVLVHGPPGSGKTTLILSIAKKFAVKLRLFYLPCDLILEKDFGVQERRLRQIFKEASQTEPSLIFLDDIDIICPEKKAQGDAERRAYRFLVRTLKTLRHKSNARVMIIAATSEYDSLDAKIRSHDLSRLMSFPLPDEEDRRLFFESRFKNVFSDENLEELARSCKYYSYVDLCYLYSKNNPNMKDLMGGIISYRPSIINSIVTPVENIRWSDIGGCDPTRKELMMAVKSQIEDLCTDYLTRPSRGVLLYGPPGCSKTMMAAALANETGNNFICIKGPELYSKYVGDTEAELRRLYKTAEQIAPSIIFFDEFDTTGSKRNTSDATGSDVSNRLVTQLLCLMDSLPPVKGVFTLAATNRPDIIDPALLRPGRFNSKIYVPLPDLEARFEIFKIHTRKARPKIQGDYDEIISRLATLTGGYSGADITEICCGAFNQLRVAGDEFLTLDHFIKALNKTRPSVSSDAVKKFEDMNRTQLRHPTPSTSQSGPFKRVLASFRKQKIK